MSEMTDDAADGIPTEEKINKAFLNDRKVRRFLMDCVRESAGREIDDIANPEWGDLERAGAIVQHIEDELLNYVNASLARGPRENEINAVMLAFRFAHLAAAASVLMGYPAKPARATDGERRHD